MRTLLLVLSAFLAMGAFDFASAQTSSGDDSADFEDGPGSAPDNADSEPVPGLGMQQPTYGGNGCPAGTLQAVISPDQRMLSVLFDQYIARASGPRGRTALECQINIPFQVPPGYRVRVVKLDYRGYTQVPDRARSTFGAGFRFLEVDGRPAPNARRVLRAKVFAGPRDENFTVSSRIRGEHWSPCGKSFTLQAESRLLAQSNPQGEEVLTTVDSLDAVAQPAVYHLKWRRCHEGAEPGRGGDVDRPGRRPEHPGRPMPRPLPPGRPFPRGR